MATLSQLAAAQRLSTRGVLVRAPRTIEALGRVDTICFDKTGTLTENRLRLVLSVPAATSPHGPFPGVADPEAARVLRAAARASTQPHEAQGHAHATDEAILKAAESYAGNSDSSGTCSPRFRSSPAAASPPRSARSSADPTAARADAQGRSRSRPAALPVRRPASRSGPRGVVGAQPRRAGPAGAGRGEAQLESRHRRRETPMPMPSTPPRTIWN